MYFDTAYIAKFYRNEQGTEDVRKLVTASPTILTSSWALTEFHAMLHRHVREGSLVPKDARLLSERFESNIDAGIWKLLPVTEAILRKVSGSLLSAPRGLFLRSGDALHLQTARDAGEREIWTNDRHMLAAAKHFGLKGRSI